MKPKHTKNDPWTRLDAMFAATKEPTGPEWFTAAELMARYGWSRSQKKKLGNLVKRGVFEKWTGTKAGTQGQLTKYRFAK